MVGRILKSKRALMGLNAEIVSKKLGISEATLLSLEHSKPQNYSFRTISRIINFYKLSPDEVKELEKLIDPDFIFET